MNQAYLDTARLLTQVAPLVLVDDTFALKGGTAINLFIRDMPRLSVDLDLVFPDYSLPRDEALARINEAIRQSADLQRAAACDAGDGRGVVRVMRTDEEWMIAKTVRRVLGVTIEQETSS